jgi:hypothetical protein
MTLDDTFHALPAMHTHTHTMCIITICMLCSPFFCYAHAHSFDFHASVILQTEKYVFIVRRPSPSAQLTIN